MWGWGNRIALLSPCIILQNTSWRRIYKGKKQRQPAVHSLSFAPFSSVPPLFCIKKQCPKNRTLLFRYFEEPSSQQDTCDCVRVWWSAWFCAICLHLLMAYGDLLRWHYTFSAGDSSFILFYIRQFHARQNLWIRNRLATNAAITQEMASPGMQSTKQ